MTRDSRKDVARLDSLAPRSRGNLLRWILLAAALIGSAGSPLAAGILHVTDPDISVSRQFFNEDIAQGAVVTMGSTQINTSDHQTFEITNNGGGDPLLVSSLTVSGPCFSKTLSPSTAPLAPDETTLFKVRFLCGTVGTYSGTVTVQSNDPNEGTFSFQVQATAYNPPTLGVVDVTPGTDVAAGQSVTLPAQDLGVSGLRRFRIENRGDISLLISNPSSVISGACFGQNAALPGSLAAGASALLDVSFSCLSVGTHTATAVLQSNDPSQGTFGWQIQGSVSEPVRNRASALWFDGVDDYVLLGDPAELDLTDSFTLEAWVWPSSAKVGTGIVVNKESSYELGVTGTGTVRWAFKNTSPGWTWVDVATVPTDTWSHLAVTYDQGTVITYVDGVAAHTQAGSGAVAPSNLGFRIGGREGGTTGNPFLGAIDEVRVWDVVRTGDEILRALHSPLAAGSAGLVADWRFDQGQGGVAPDAGPAGLHGVLTGGPQWVGDDRAPSYAAQVGPSSIDVMTLSANTALHAPPALTMEAWIHPRVGSGSGRVINQEGEYRMSLSPASEIRWSLNNTSPGWQVVNTGVRVPEGVWSHVAVTYDGAQVKTYLDGVLAHSQAAGGPIVARSPALGFRLGGWITTAETAFEGFLDDARVWSVARSAAEIADGRLTRMTGAEPGLLASWDFDELAGAKVVDRAGSHDLGFGGVAARVGDTRPSVSRALSLDGAGDWVSFGTLDSLQPGGAALTVEAWARPVAGSLGGAVVARESSYLLGLSDAHTLRWALRLPTPGWVWVDTGVPVPDDVWSHLAVVYDGAAVRSYIDGQEVHSQPASGMFGVLPLTFRIGAREHANGNAYHFFTGDIDEVRIWDLARTEAELQAAMDVQLDGSEAGLLGYWDFDSDGPFVWDRTTAGNHGSRVGGAGSVEQPPTMRVIELASGGEVSLGSRLPEMTELLLPNQERELLYTVENAGLGELNLDSLVVSPLFGTCTGSAALGRASIGPGEATEMAVRVSCAQEGNFEQQVSWSSNDPLANPFSFSVLGVMDDGVPEIPPLTEEELRAWIWAELWPGLAPETHYLELSPGLGVSTQQVLESEADLFDVLVREVETGSNAQTGRFEKIGTFAWRTISAPEPGMEILAVHFASVYGLMELESRLQPRIVSGVQMVVEKESPEPASHWMVVLGIHATIAEAQESAVEVAGIQDPFSSVPSAASTFDSGLANAVGLMQLPEMPVQCSEYEPIRGRTGACYTEHFQTHTAYSECCTREFNTYEFALASCDEGLAAATVSCMAIPPTAPICLGRAAETHRRCINNWTRRWETQRDQCVDDAKICACEAGNGPCDAFYEVQLAVKGIRPGINDSVFATLECGSVRFRQRWGANLPVRFFAKCSAGDSFRVVVDDLIEPSGQTRPCQPSVITRPAQPGFSTARVGTDCSPGVVPDEIVDLEVLLRTQPQLGPIKIAWRVSSPVVAEAATTVIPTSPTGNAQELVEIPFKIPVEVGTAYEIEATPFNSSTFCAPTHFSGDTTGESAGVLPVGTVDCICIDPTACEPLIIDKPPCTPVWVSYPPTSCGITCETVCGPAHHQHEVVHDDGSSTVLNVTADHCELECNPSLFCPAEVQLICVENLSRQPIRTEFAAASGGGGASNAGPVLEVDVSADFVDGQLVPTALDDVLYVDGTARDPDGVRAHAIYIDGQLESFEEFVTPRTDASFSVALDVSHLSSGSHELTIYVVDNDREVMGFSAHHKDTFRILRDSNPTCAEPTVRLISPLDDSEVSGLVTLSAQASSSDSTIDWVDFRVDGVDVFRSTGPGPHSWDWDTAGLSGSHQLMAIARATCGSQKASAVVDVTVFNGPNQPPVTQDDHAVVRCGEAEVLPVTVNDTDPDGDEVVLVGSASFLPAPPTAGTVTKVSATSLRYEPAAGCDEGGSDSFTYRVGDGRGLRATAQVTVDILPITAPPVAEADQGFVALGQSLVMNLTANDHDPDGGTPTLVGQAQLLPTPPTLGAVTRLNGQEIRYTPTAAGTDTFEYQIGDLQGRRATGSVTVEVGLPEVTVPVAEDAYVNQRPGFESTNAGGAQILRVRTAQGLGLHSYLKFQVSGVTGTVRSARLRVKVGTTPIGSLGVWTVTDPLWTELGITWLTAPLTGAKLVTQTGFLAAETWHEIDVTSAVSGNGTYSIVLATALDMGALNLASRESGDAPELIVTYEP